MVVEFNVIRRSMYKYATDYFGFCILTSIYLVYGSTFSSDHLLHSKLPLQLGLREICGCHSNAGVDSCLMGYDSVQIG